MRGIADLVEELDNTMVPKAEGRLRSAASTEAAGSLRGSPSAAMH